MMRIITGTAKGIKLKTIEGETTRPTAERVKEAVFSMIQFDLEGRSVLDLFAGSGQMSLEALSRGASRAIMVDQSKDAIRVINENAKKTKLDDKCKIIQSDALDFIRRNCNEKFDIVFIDPPYASDLYCSTLREVLNADMLKSMSLVVCESDSEDILAKDENLLGRLEFRKVVRYGKSVVTILSLKGE